MGEGRGIAGIDQLAEHFLIGLRPSAVNQSLENAQGASARSLRRSVMGSHRLRVALAILFKNQFRCPYCNESTALELRHSPRHVANHWSQLD